MTTTNRTIPDDIRFPGQDDIRCPDEDSETTVLTADSRDALEPRLVAALAAESTGYRAWDRYTTVTLGPIREIEVISETPVDRESLRDSVAYTAFIAREFDAAVAFDADRQQRAEREAARVEAHERVMLRALTQKFGTPG